MAHEKVYGTRVNKCKLEVASKEELEKYLPVTSKLSLSGSQLKVTDSLITVNAKVLALYSRVLNGSNLGDEITYFNLDDIDFTIADGSINFPSSSVSSSSQLWLVYLRDFCPDEAYDGTTYKLTNYGFCSNKCKKEIIQKDKIRRELPRTMTSSVIYSYTDSSIGFTGISAEFQCISGSLLDYYIHTYELLAIEEQTTDGNWHQVDIFNLYEMSIVNGTFYRLIYKSAYTKSQLQNVRITYVLTNYRSENNIEKIGNKVYGICENKCKVEVLSLGHMSSILPCVIKAEKYSGQYASDDPSDVNMCVNDAYLTDNAVIIGNFYVISNKYTCKYTRSNICVKKIDTENGKLIFTIPYNKEFSTYDDFRLVYLRDCKQL